MDADIEFHVDWAQLGDKGAQCGSADDCEKISMGSQWTSGDNYCFWSGAEQSQLDLGSLIIGSVVYSSLGSRS
jgi:hypothetical protein